MPDDASSWVLPLRQDPVSELTRTFRARHRLGAGFDIDKLVANYADVYEYAWPFDCDAVVARLSSGRPELYLRQLPAHLYRRRRFTLGHELGHLIIPWHLGRTACHGFSYEDAPNDEALGAAGRQIAKQESEATEFASSLLVPQDLIVQTAQGASLQDLFDQVDAFGVSTMATILALRKDLLPGFVFLFNDGESQCMESSGTSLPRGAWGNRAELRRIAYESGVFECGGRRVQWYLVNEAAAFEPVDDPRSTSELLRAAIEAEGLDDEAATRLFQRINGVVSGKLSKDRAATADQALTIVRGTVRDHGLIPDAVRDHPDFDRYLRRKAEARVSKKE